MCNPPIPGQFVSNKEQDPWWRVDLGKEYIITGKEEGEWFIYIQK